MRLQHGPDEGLAMLKARPRPLLEAVHDVLLRDRA